MKVALRDFSGSVLGELDLDQSIFGCKLNPIVLKEVINWQLAKRRSGCHKTKEIQDISGTTKKPHPQKRGGRSRQGSLRSPQYRGGAVCFGPVVRDHGYDLNKKVRKLGLKMALSDKIFNDQISFVSVLPSTSKTKDAVSALKNIVSDSVKRVIIYDHMTPIELANSFRNIANLDLISVDGINVYDLVRHDKVIITKSALDLLEKRLS